MKKEFQQSVVSIYGPLGYGPSTLPLRHSALVTKGAHKAKLFQLEQNPADEICSTKAKFKYVHKGPKIANHSINHNIAFTEKVPYQFLQALKVLQGQPLGIDAK